MAATATDPKVAALAAARSLNPHPEKVVDEAFLASPFCDARDLVQVKYEMVRRVRVDKVPVAQATRAFGYCRQAFYEIAAALDAGGPSALIPGKPGPKGPTKLTAQAMDLVCDWLAAEPALSSRQLAVRLRDELCLAVHPRSIERALVRRREPEDAGDDVPIARRAVRP
ncbi:helix-turn-helix domain containing protein [Streptomyces sp. NPDC046900]|uniref:helix-turn-helix domain containing protein n=1 Tax=Streptomyces sp. NPDC046900 TaxID=3155473 RepID=UPI0033F0CB0E